MSPEFGLVRVVTTLNRFTDVAGRPPRVGDWFALDLVQDSPAVRLPTWYAGLTELGYTTLARGHTTSITFLADDEADGPRPSSLGAAVAPALQLPPDLGHACSLSPFVHPSSDAAISSLLSNLPVPVEVVVHDVGQANFTESRNASGRAVFFYDVGLPISFNGHTAPKSLAFDAKGTAPVILSHWDWDHLHAALSSPALLERPWIVPRQKLGPGAARVAHILAAKNNLHVWTGRHLPTPFGSLVSGGGPYGDHNNSGLAVHVSLQGGKTALLVGDADYNTVQLPGGMPTLDYLVATHHGAVFSGGSTSVPAPTVPGRPYILSYGTKNVYRHPRQQALMDHARAGWRHAIPTAGRRGQPRGNRVLGP
ncbi:hypothetical protein AA309_05405 [Microvirga vignae]|uniref:Metallo-beta-lactamase domain-containing protein n=1 Tax=Microvirga vignae TaxID=1225564 RepID=A0A0H1RMQ5_9HYPH|nr:hypothetical protein [Microvirga vignae]KLK93922.1 hypothetical protein AA309_05405 [Microvirga vignae]